ncbi:MAG: preprotein translocase subunit YajC [Prevotellaceae bacterium]|jgi:preprotein translocase subunit YajC|nr:preprotein translocase subunit YajC [Prevotellaceae bacterium]
MNILLQVADAAKPNPLMTWLPIILIFAVFYFLLIRPQQKRQKEVQKQRESLKLGDKVVTSGGIHGIIKEIKDNAVLIEIADNVKIKVDKSSVFPSSEDAQAAQTK